MLRPPSALRPALAAVLFVGWVLAHLVLAIDGGRVVTGAVPGVGRWLGPVNWAIYAVIALVLAVVLGAWRSSGITRSPRRGWPRLAAVPVAAGLPFVLFGWNVDGADIVPLLVVGTPLIALNEELFFRGIVLDLLRPLGWRSAILGSAVLFGAAHAANLVAGANPAFTAMQIAATTAGGVALAAIRIRTGSLWPCLVAHVAIDLIAIATLTGPATESPLLLPILFTWLATNLALWRFGWRLVSHASPVELDALAEGRLVAVPPTPQSLEAARSSAG